MKKIITILFTLVVVSLSAQSLYNPATLSPSTRNISVTKGFQVIDTALLKGKVWIPTGATNGFVLTADANGFATWQAAGAGSSYLDSNSAGIFVADTTQKFGVGTAYPQYTLDVRGGFSSASSNGQLLNGVPLLGAVPFTGVYKPLNSGDNVVLGNINVSAFTTASDSSVIYLGYNDFASQTHGLTIKPVDSTVELHSRKSLDITANTAIDITANTAIDITATDTVKLNANKVTLANNYLRLTNAGVDSNNTGPHQVLMGTDVFYTGNTALNGAAFNSNQLWHGGSSIVDCYSDAMGYNTFVGPGQQFIYGHDNFRYVRDTTLGSAVSWDIQGPRENCTVADNLIETLTDTIAFSMLDNILLSAFDSLSYNRIQGYYNAIREITMLGYSHVVGNKLNTGSHIRIGNGTMLNSDIRNFTMQTENQQMWGFSLFNTQLSGLTNHSLNNVYFINRGAVDLSGLSGDINNTTWIGATTKIDNLQMQGGIIFYNTDSATIYALPSPATGETYYCTDCTPTDNSAGGVKVCYNGTLWRREW